MEITLDKKNSTEGLIKIKIGEGDYQPSVEQKVRDYARKANIKGFRSGKVPTGVIKKMFGKSILVDEINHILSHKLNDYIKENQIRIIGEPIPSQDKAQNIDWDNQKDFEFEYMIGMVDEFSYDLSSKVKVKSYPIEVDKKTIDETVSDLRKRFGKVSYPETSEIGDNVFGPIRAVEGDWNKESSFLATDKITKKEQSKFIGLKKEDEVEFDVSKLFSSDSDAAEFLGVAETEKDKLKGKYILKIENISRTDPAEINQELFDRVFGKDAVSSKEEFEKKVEETVGGNYARETEYFLEHHIEDHFISNTKINLPEQFLREWLKLTGEGKVTDEVLTNEFDAYVRNLKWDLIKNKIADDNKISVEADEVKAKAKELIVSQFGGAAFAEQMQDKLDSFADNYLSHENGQNFMKLYNQLRNDKIMAHIKSNLTVQEKKVSVDEFKKIVEDHKH